MLRVKTDKIYFYCRTVEGMSGSPVIALHSEFWAPDDKLSGDSVIGTVNNFIGIYSGRLYGQSVSDEPRGEISAIGIHDE